MKILNSIIKIPLFSVFDTEFNEFVMISGCFDTLGDDLASDSLCLNAEVKGDDPAFKTE